MKKIIVLIFILAQNYSKGAITICYTSSQGSTVCEKSIVDLKCDDPTLLNLLGAALPQGWTCTESRLIINRLNVSIKYDKFSIAVLDNNGDIIPIASDAFNLLLKKDLTLIRDKKMTKEQFLKEIIEFKKKDNGVASQTWVNSLAKELNIKIIKTSTPINSSLIKPIDLVENNYITKALLANGFSINGPELYFVTDTLGYKQYYITLKRTKEEASEYKLHFVASNQNTTVAPIISETFHTGRDTVLVKFYSFTNFSFIGLVKFHTGAGVAKETEEDNSDKPCPEKTKTRKECIQCSLDELADDPIFDIACTVCSPCCAIAARIACSGFRVMPNKSFEEIKSEVNLQIKAGRFEGEKTIEVNKKRIIYLY